MTTHALCNMKDTSYNALGGTIISSPNKTRVGFKLDSGKKISVRPECVIELTNDELAIRGMCCVCFEDTRSFECKSMPCDHILCRICWSKMHSAHNDKIANMHMGQQVLVLDDMTDEAIRCPVCKVLVSPSTCMWYEQSVDLLIMGNIGAICQLYHRLMRLPEPSVSEEAQWIEKCSRLADTQLKEQGSSLLQHKRDFEMKRKRFVSNPIIGSDANFLLQDSFLQLLIVFVVHPCFDNDIMQKALLQLIQGLSGTKL